MTDQLSPIFSRVLCTVAQIRQSDRLPPAHSLRQHLTHLLEKAGTEAREKKIPEVDIDDARYALTAFADELLLARADWADRKAWEGQPLQYSLFAEMSAGNGFFDRLGTLVQEPHRRAALQVFYSCLAAGFMGKYAVLDPSDRLELMKDLQQRLGLHLESEPSLSPNLASGAGHQPPRRSRAWRVTAYSALLAAAAVVAYLGLRSSVHHYAAQELGQES